MKRWSVLASTDLHDLRLGSTWLLCIPVELVWRVSRTSLAAWVLAVDTNLVQTKCGIAAVTGAAHAHADRFGDSDEL